MVNDKQAAFEKKLNNLLTLCGARQALYVEGPSAEVLESVDELIDQARDELLIQVATGNLPTPDLSSVVLPGGVNIVPNLRAMAQPRRPVPGQADSKVPKTAPKGPMHVPDLVDPVKKVRPAVVETDWSAKTVDHLFGVLDGINVSPDFNRMKWLNTKVWRNNSPILMALEYHKDLINKTAQSIDEGMK